MNGINRQQIMGNLTREPSVRATKTGKRVVNFSVAVNEKVQGANGEVELTSYINIVAWGYLADIAATLVKGQQVYVEGRQTTRSYEDQSGQKKYVTETNATTIAVIPKGQSRGDFSQFGHPSRNPDHEIPF